MNLNHLNLPVTDLDAARVFLETYFGMRLLHTNQRMAFLGDENGMLLGLTQDKAQAARYPDSFHIGFIQASEDSVNEIYQRLRADGITAPPPARMHGSWTFYVQAPGGFTVEVQAVAARTW
ncbi:MAG TPA: VOC family protein [Herpetosiphonaceae bacterium]